ncbi:Uncaracterized surface protein containing fasciclin (FAS1) repeats [Tranquillimonas rosea]|uniref:Uncaracterized surface protein containing fasciclin (FAS1) repeats n=1 Tax=Tranquillimonas rosea TaxID=641238 RepID=A0A1H9UVW7_9RHOB|nr:fasciclin domain-containing protein [Tranquillimonas rosea]SES13207.1 Uncaracterized surface protein containing fasciclin (FAS1) repeats [Tranquillimonas rosea]
MLKTTLFAALVAGTATVAAAQDTMSANPTVGGAEMMADMTIAENASNAPNLTTLVSAVQAAGMGETLMGAGPFTVFAPTNDAFGMIRDASLEALLMEENQAQLQQILGCHVVSAEAFSSDIAGMIEDDGGRHAVPTVGGCTLQAYMEGGELKLEDENGRVATVTTADVDQSNGVVHVIDRVMLPAGQAG